MPTANIVAQLEPLAYEVGRLQLDPANARRHDKRNVDAIKASLTLFGQRKPIVATDAGIVIAGNGTLQAAKELGWERIAVVFVNDDTAKAAAYGIADNRTAELAAWDDDVLGTLLGGLADTEINMADLGFTEQELKNLIGNVTEAGMPELGSGDRDQDSLGTITIRLTVSETEEVSAWLDTIKPNDPSAAILLACRKYAVR